MKMSVPLAVLFCVCVESALSAPVRKYTYRNRVYNKGQWETDVDDLLEVYGGPSTKVHDIHRNFRPIREVHQVNTKAIDETIKALNSIMDSKEKPEETLASRGSVGDVKNVDSKDIDKTLNDLVSILDTVGDIPVRMDTYVERPTPKQKVNHGSHDTGSDVIQSPKAPKPETIVVPPPTASTDEIAEVKLPKENDVENGVIEEEEEKGELPVIPPKEESIQDETPSREDQFSEPIKVDIPGYNSKLYAQPDAHDKLSGNGVYMSVDDEGADYSSDTAKVVIKGVNVLTTAKPHGLEFYHQVSRDDESMNRFAHYEVTLLSLLVLLLLKAFLGIALYSKCQDLKQMNKLRVVYATSKTDESKPEEGGILGMAEMVSKFAFDIDEQPKLLLSSESSSEDETKMKKFKKMFSFKKKKGKDKKKDKNPKDKSEKSSNKGFSMKNPFASKNSPPRSKVPPPPPPRSKVPPPPPPAPKKSTKAPPPPPRQKTKPPPPPGKTPKAPPLPPPKQTTLSKPTTPPPPPRQSAKAPPPPPSQATKAPPPPPPSQSTKARPPPPPSQ